MKWYSYLICVVLIIGGFFSSLFMFNVWSQTSGVVGTATTIETKSDYTLTAKFDIGTIAFETNDNVNYVFTESRACEEFDGTKSNYALLFNDTLVSNTTISAGKVIAVCSINFYDNDGDITSVATLNISILFYEKQATINITMQNENDSYAYLTRYINNNGAILKIVERGATL